ncbi:dipeptidase [Zhaonella formicivorans]|jgi:membrane dipeptidase|uniref:dipeptidase n=1 Tax=Zhaonella formicivorans TaxID=2528593 RepID=UPI0010DFD2D3|nr:dipeptidase [Zhaonella formicivorans]
MMLVVDAHCDTMLDVIRGKRRLGTRSSQGHVDLPRLLEAGVKVQIFALFIETVYKPNGALRRALQQIAAFYEEVESNRDRLKVITSRQDLQQVLTSAGTVGAILSIEGGEALEGDLGVLECLFRLGVRCLGLTWNQRNAIADGVGERLSKGGLTSFGRKVVNNMNRLGMVIDLAHIAEQGFWDVLEVTTKPLLVSHANCQSVYNHYRNLNDAQIKALAQNQGVLGVTFAPEFVAQEASVAKVVEHIDHACQLLGNVLHVGIGSDFDGTDPMTPGLEDVTRLSNLIAGLDKRGYKTEEIAKILGKNILRVLEANLI